MSKNQSKTRKIIYRICLTAVFLAFAVVSKFFFSIPIPLFGVNGLRVGFAGVFTVFPAILFGPLYGGVTSGLSDIIGYLMKPEGAYIPWLTVTAFCGGCLKGLIWILIIKRKEIKFRVGVLILCVIIGGFGISTHLSLLSDGVMRSSIASQDKLPTKNQIAAMDLSPLSKITTDLAQYNNDTVAIKNVDNSSEVIVVPAKVIIDGEEYNTRSIRANAFSNCANLKTVYIPESIATVDKDAFKGLNVEIIREDVEITTLVVSSDTYIAEGYTLTSPYRENLAAFVNFTTLGMYAILLLGLIYLATDIIFTKFSKKEKKSGNFVKFLITVVLSGVFVTTVNTQILIWFIEAWNGRSFLILWIPRVIEEIIVCSVQAYIITILYDVYINKIAPRFQKEVKI